MSPGSEERDYVEKRDEYREFGVREYWIIDSGRGEVLVLRRSRGRWVERVVRPGDVYRTRLLPGLAFDPAPVFAAAGMMYLAVTTLIAGAQFVLERRVSPDADRRPRPRGETALGRLFGFRWRLPEREPVAAAVDGAADGALAPPSRATRVNLVELVGAQAARVGAEPGVPFVRCVDVWKSYGHRAILQGIDFTVGRGDVVTLMGPSGSGKSTLLRLIAHL